MDLREKVDFVEKVIAMDAEEVLIVADRASSGFERGSRDKKKFKFEFF